MTSAFNLHSIPGVQGVSNTVSGLKNLSSNILNREPAKTEQSVGLLSSFGVAMSKGRSTVLDRLLDISLSILSFWLSILRKITPPFVRSFLIFFIPPILGFYELAFRVYFPRLPSLFAIAFKLHKRGYLTIGTVVWLASSLPGDILGGLVALGGVATHATEVVVGGVSSVGNALAGTATHVVGDAANTLSHLGDGLHAIPTGGLFPHIGQGQDAIQGAVSNANTITGAVIGSTQGIATELVHVLDPLHLISKGSQDSQSVNPLHLNIAPKGLQASPVPNPIGSLLHPKIPGLRS